MISAALDGKERERELASRVLSTLYPDVLSTAVIGKGFERLFETVDDLAIDAPQYD
jgi:programmed cell death protein 4